GRHLHVVRPGALRAGVLPHRQARAVRPQQGAHRGRQPGRRRDARRRVHRHRRHHRGGHPLTRALDRTSTALLGAVFCIPTASLALGAVSALAGLGVAVLFPTDLRRPRRLFVVAALAVALLTVGLATSEQLTKFVEDDLYPHEVLLSTTTRYQRIVVTRSTAG